MSVGLRSLFIQTGTLTNATITFADMVGLTFNMPAHSSFFVDLVFQATGNSTATGEQTKLLNADAADSLMITTFNSTGNVVSSFAGNLQSNGNFTGTVWYRGIVTNPTAAAKVLKVQGAVQSVSIGSATFTKGSMQVIRLT